VVNLGVSVLSGAATTSVSGIIMFATTIYFFTLFGYFIVATILLALCFALGLFPALLFYFGTPRWSNLRRVWQPPGSDDAGGGGEQHEREALFAHFIDKAERGSGSVVGIGGTSESSKRVVGEGNVLQSESVDTRTKSAGGTTRVIKGNGGEYVVQHTPDDTPSGPRLQRIFVAVACAAWIAVSLILAATTTPSSATTDVASPGLELTSEQCSSSAADTINIKTTMPKPDNIITGAKTQYMCTGVTFSSKCTTWVKKFSIYNENPRLVHHMILFSMNSKMSQCPFNCFDMPDSKGSKNGYDSPLFPLKVSAHRTCNPTCTPPPPPTHPPHVCRHSDITNHVRSLKSLLRFLCEPLLGALRYPRLPWYLP
jgi:hypothetical protein